MNCFEKMIDDIFRVPQFIDTFSYTDNSTVKQVTCIQYTMQTDAMFTQYGVDEGIDFVLTCKCSDFTPKKNQKITYHGQEFKIVSWKTDGFNLSYNLNVKSVTSK